MIQLHRTGASTVTESDTVLIEGLNSGNVWCVVMLGQLDLWYICPLADRLSTLYQCFQELCRQTKWGWCMLSLCYTETDWTVRIIHQYKICLHENMCVRHKTFLPSYRFKMKLTIYPQALKISNKVVNYTN